MELKKKTKTTSPAKPVVEGTKDISEYVKIEAQIKALEAVQEEMKKKISDLAKKYIEAEQDYMKSIYLKDPETADKVLVTFSSAFSKIDTNAEAELILTFGEKFKMLFEENTKAEIRNDMINKLKEKLGSDYELFVKEEKFLAPTEAFDPVIFSLKKKGELSPKELKALDDIDNQVRRKPSIRSY
jgi:hypothetical protein